MKGALVNLIKSLFMFVWEVLKWFGGTLNRSFIQDTLVPIVFGAMTVEAYKHEPYMVAPLIFLFAATMTRNVHCSDLERWRRDHPQTRAELDARLDQQLEESPLPGVDYVTPSKPWSKRVRS